jgi:hypothetical protein
MVPTTVDRSEGTSEVNRFSVGDPVTTTAAVRPARFASRHGTVVATTSDEVGVHFGPVSNHGAATWFRLHEVRWSPSEPPGSPTDPTPGLSVPARTK